MSIPIPPEPTPERDNGLQAVIYRHLRTVDRRECDLLLDAMAGADIACYTAIPDDPAQSTREVFVDADKHGGAAQVADDAHRRFAARRVSLDPEEVELRFAELVGAFGDPSDVPDAPASPPPAREPTSHASASEAPAVPWRGSDGDSLADASGHDDDDDDDEGFEPPPAEPLPKPTGKVVLGILLMIAGCVAIFAPSSMPIDSTASLVTGVLLLGAGTAWLVMQLRTEPEDPFDDGSRV